MSPILVRPVREQLEHDRVIRLLQAKYKRKFEVAINPGTEQTAPVGTGTAVWYPDLVLQSAERGRKLLGVVEVETTESVNNLEAMAQWAAFARLRAPFHLYVPAASVDSARRLCADLQIPVDEIWAYHTVGDQIRFVLVHRTTPPPEVKPRAAAEGGRPAAARPAAPPARVNGAPAKPARAAASRSARRAQASGARRSSTSSKGTGLRRTAKTSARKAAGTARAQKRR